MLVDFTPLAAVAIRRNRRKRKKKNNNNKKGQFCFEKCKAGKRKEEEIGTLGLNNVTALN
jgi:hypothetical protein